MVEFGTGYSMPMDREYGHFAHSQALASPSSNSTNDVSVSIGELGMSLGLGPVPNVPAVQAKMRGGVKALELGFMGMGKGSGQGHTPEMYGKKQRQALEELQKVNRVDFTTHSTVGVYGLAGMDQQGNFSKTSKNNSVQEIKRAIEFAADVARGGAVVVHTGEFHRPIVDAEWNGQDEQWRDKFRLYEEEPERATYRVVDTRTGHLVQEARKNRKVSQPVWNRYEEGTKEWTEYGGKSYSKGGKVIQPGDYIDYEGGRLDPERRVPKYDYEAGTFMVRQLDWNDLVKQSEELTKRAREVWREWKSGVMSDEDFQKSNWIRFKTATSEKEIAVRPEEAYIITTMETNAANSRGWAYYYGSGFENDIRRIKNLKSALEYYEKLEQEIPEEEKWKVKLQLRESGLDQLVPEEAKFPSEWIKRELRQREHHLKQAQEASAAQWTQAAESMESIRHIESAETYALKEAYDAYAQAAISAMEHTKRLEKEGKLKKPLFIAMENLFPETFGAHPDELVTLVQNSRQRMQQMLVQRGMPEEEAGQKAKTHIGATLDTGHLNMWRKYWRGDPQKTLQQNDEEFNVWMMKKVEGMMDAGILAHVHLDDNHGYQDDHLAPGEGNTPIKQVVELLKKKGFDKSMIVEPGADYTTDVSGFHSMMKTWRMFGSPVYGARGSFGGPPRRSWNEVGYGWFGQNQPPYFTFGAYSPSEDWTLWSGVPLE